MRFASALAEVANAIRRRSPAPKDQPYYGLDHPLGVGPKLLDQLSELGIFRYYERVLDLDASLGATARWLARRRGCEVVSLAESPTVAAANALLTRRAHLHEAVSVVVGAPEAIPAPDEAFTHAWSLAPLPRGETLARRAAELYRVVRPGGHVALQDWLSGEESDASPGREGVLRVLRAAGFREVHAEQATDLVETESTIAGIVRERVLEALGHPLPSERSAIAAAFLALEAREQRARSGELVLTQIFAQRPA